MGATVRWEIGNVNDAANRYRTDAAAIWGWICGGRKVQNPEGEAVRLIADRRLNGDTGPWIVEEEPWV